ncbi:zinc-binding dehydrogenase [Actinomadura sp. NPDC000600]|uniref:zinc-binding dehydrogenase n=1 Tax=Actinomadura sp. NPDC000600 TaxID=3154262 RepID=UPI003397B7D2
MPTRVGQEHHVADGEREGLTLFGNEPAGAAQDDLESRRARNGPGQLAELVALIDAGAVRVDATASRPLTELPAVHRDAEAGRTSGKAILIP